MTSLFVGQLELDAGDLELKRRWRTWLVQPERALPHRIPGCGAAQSRVFAADKQWRVAPTHLRHQTHSAAQRKKCFGILIKIWQHTKVNITFCGRNRFPGEVSIYITCYPIPAPSAIYDIHMHCIHPLCDQHHHDHHCHRPQRLPIKIFQKSEQEKRRSGHWLRQLLFSANPLQLHLFHYHHHHHQQGGHNHHYDYYH